MSRSSFPLFVGTIVLSTVVSFAACSSSDGGVGVCEPGEKVACAYTGPAGTEGKGACVAGEKTCLAGGSAFGACAGEVLPKEEDCATAVDDDCDGSVNEADAGCVCTPGESVSCYEGPDGTSGVGLCAPGTKTCALDGRTFGDCSGQVLPTAETCATAGDDDCDGFVNEDGSGCGCQPGDVAACYSGASATRDVGRCKSGTQTCLQDGSGFSACQGEILPVAETCLTAEDDDCDGLVNEEGQGCVCVPNASTSCYSGPAGTAGVGTCRAGTRICNATGTSETACSGEVLPVVEICDNGVDDDCDGVADEGCGVSFATDVKPILVKYCASCHGSSSFTSSYSASQAPSGRCSGKTQGECALERINDGSMPPSKSCASDFSGTHCPTQQERTTIQEWINDGQRP